MKLIGDACNQLESFRCSVWDQLERIGGACNQSPESEDAVANHNALSLISDALSRISASILEAIDPTQCTTIWVWITFSKIFHKYRRFDTGLKFLVYWVSSPTFFSSGVIIVHLNDSGKTSSTSDLLNNNVSAFSSRVLASSTTATLTILNYTQHSKVTRDRVSVNCRSASLYCSTGSGSTLYCSIQTSQTLPSMERGRVYREWIQ